MRKDFFNPNLCPPSLASSVGVDEVTAVQCINTRQRLFRRKPEMKGREREGWEKGRRKKKEKRQEGRGEERRKEEKAKEGKKWQKEGEKRVRNEKWEREREKGRDKEEMREGERVEEEGKGGGGSAPSPLSVLFNPSGSFSSGLARKRWRKKTTRTGDVSHDFPFPPRKMPPRLNDVRDTARYM